MTTAILLLAYGGPDSLDDVPAYLADVRGGRPTPPELLAEIIERYRAIGGRSPLLAITRQLAARLQETTGRPVYVGMRHWHPFIRETVTQMAADGVTRAAAICLAPQYSRLSIGAYRARLDEALAALSAPLRIAFVESWHTHPALIEGLAEQTRAAWVRLSQEAADRAMVVFTAHSLPASLSERGDPYAKQVQETAQLVAQRLALPPTRWRLAYQSAAQTGTPWLGPSVEETIPLLAAEGVRDLVLSPIGFLADHVEVLYDLDIAAQAIGRAHGVRIERAPMLNASPALVTALADLAQQALEERPQ